MEKEDINVKYQKLATEYSKIRASVLVLKRAILAEQAKTMNLRENLRTNEQAHRRTEQELDSVSFRNKQLDKRCLTLQEELEREIRKPFKSMKNNKLKTNIETDSVVEEELQKTIIENARLASLISDKNSEIDLYISRISDLEHQHIKHITEHSDLESKLRKEIEQMSIKIANLEAKSVESNSSICSDDVLSVSGAPLHTVTNSTSEERILSLEKEVNHWRAQCEISKMFVSNQTNSKMNLVLSNDGRIYARNSSEISGETEISSEQIFYDNISKQIEELLMRKSLAESKVSEYIAECESLKNNLQIMEDVSRENDRQFDETQMLLQQTEEDLATTRINYDEQISILTEQVINLSEQLAASK